MAFVILIVTLLIEDGRDASLPEPSRRFAVGRVIEDWVDPAAVDPLAPAVRFQIDQSTRSRDRRMVGRSALQSDARKSRNANESAARQAIPRSESRPSKDPISSSRK